VDRADNLIMMARPVIAVVGAVSLLTGCGADTSGPRAVATAFVDAVAGGRGQQACARLAPGTVTEISREQPCEAAVLEAGLPPPTQVRLVESYGREARVVLATDTLFLAEFPGGWRVTAAGCAARADRPYDCAISGA
jgi:hypothetical protein